MGVFQWQWDILQTHTAEKFRYFFGIASTKSPYLHDKALELNDDDEPFPPGCTKKSTGPSNLKLSGCQDPQPPRIGTLLSPQH